ncbi:MAG TPA: lipoprotein [Burkholderiales bacterium]|jgi:predicted small lipoprotein YifL|nr:lipoprotein [Burkholderiales bacterium]
MRFLLLGVAITLLVGCGQKGPLYLRDNPPPGIKPEKPAPAKPIPYPPGDDTEQN